MRTAWLCLLLISSCCRLSHAQIRLLPEYAPGQPVVAEATFGDAPENATAHVLWSVGGEAGYLPVSATKIAVWPRYGLKTQELSVRCSGFLTIAGSDGQEVLVKDSFREWIASTVILGIGESPRPEPPQPPPTPDTPAPIPVPGLRVLIVYESKDLPTMAKEQQAILFDRDVREFLASNCVKVSNVPEWRIVDQNVQVYGEQQIWKDALARPRSAMPWLIISNGKSGFEGPLPKSKAEFTELVKSYAAG